MPPPPTATTTETTGKCLCARSSIATVTALNIDRVVASFVFVFSRISPTNTLPEPSLANLKACRFLYR